jgi:hypothetical protein
MLDLLEGVKLPAGNVKDPEYNRVFNETAKKVYKVITGRSSPESVMVM